MWDGNVLVLRPRYVNVPGEPSWALPDRSVAMAAWRSRRHWDGAAVIHGHYAITGLAAWRVARRTGLPFFLTFHGDDMNTWPDEHPDRRADLLAAVSDASGVFAVSRALADRVHDVTGVSAIPLPLGCNHAWIQQASRPRAEARRLLGLPEDLLIVLFVGYLQRQKGVRELASAILDLGDPFLAVFVGDGPELGYATDDPRASGRLLYQGSRSHEDAIRYMSAADVLVLPSYGEGLPTVLVEAGSVGLPVVASAVGGIPELLGEDRGTLLPGVSAPAIAEALSSFATHRPEAGMAAERLREHVHAEYDVNTNARHLLTHYRSTGGV
jgi:teichuronic acid biosynthesis glycosyltransferase TuaC